MSKLVFSLLFFFCTGTISAQNASDIGKINLAVTIPDNISGISEGQLSQLETKIVRIVSSSGIVTNGYNDMFIISPKLDIIKNDIVEGGMQNIYTVSADLSLFIMQEGNSTLFSSMSTELKGSGSSKQDAISNAINSINPGNPEYKTFIEKAKAKIILYYEDNCNRILTQADNLEKKQDHVGALSLLMSIPSEINKCYATAQKKSIEIYAAYQNHACSQMMQAARAKVAAQDYETALDILANIDLSSKCGKDAAALISSVENKVSAEQKQAMDLILKVYNDNVELEKHRINAIKEIAVAEYKHKHGSRKKSAED